jgi:hypothetical protein
MRINVCTPTRGKPDRLAEFVSESIRNSVLDTTRFVIGIDDDDTDSLSLAADHDKIIISVAPREDALGAKYNRCAKAYDADIYVMGLDDVAISTPGWDEKLAEAASVFPDGIGCVYFGKEPHGESLPSMQAATKRLVDLMGFFVVPHFPFWWGNTSLDEIAHMIGRVVEVDIETRYPTTFDKPQRRDILFWAKFFDDTRPWREKIAERVLREIRKPLMQAFEQRNSRLRDPRFAQAVERDLSADVPLDSRHARLRQQAEAIVSSL